MLTLNTLKFKNIRSFDSEHTLNFATRDKIFLIDGKSGYGKTSILLALDYLLGINDIPSTVLQNRYTKEPMEVMGSFQVDGKSLIIKRSKKDGLSVEFDNITTTSAKLAEEKIDEIIGVPRKLLKRMVHKKQQERGFFLNLTPKEMYQFLIEMLDLGPYLEKSSKIEEQVKKLAGEQVQISHNVDIANSNVKELDILRDEQKTPVCNISKEDIDKLKANAKELNDQITIVSKEWKEEASKIIKKQVSLQAPDTKEAITVKKELEEARASKNSLITTQENLQQQLNSVAIAKAKAQHIGAKIRELRQQQSEMTASTCPTCHQMWAGQTYEDEKSKIASEINKNISFALELKQIIDTEPGYRQTLEHVQGDIFKIDGKIEKLSVKSTELEIKQRNYQKELANLLDAAENEYQVKCHAINEKYRDTLTPLNDCLTKVNLELNSAETTLSHYKKALAECEMAHTSLLNKILRKKDEVAHLEADLERITRKIAVAEEVLRLIKTYVLQKFQDTLDSIGTIATNILSAIPNMVNSTVYFENCKETKSGSIKNEVTAILNVNGTNAIPIKSFSGGEGTVLDLAIDLAVIDTIETKTGKGASFLFIDEPFDGLDNECKENYLEILRQIDINKQIVIVDHSPELKEMISDVVTVQKNGESSVIL